MLHGNKLRDAPFRPAHWRNHVDPKQAGFRGVCSVQMRYVRRLETRLRIHQGLGPWSGGVPSPHRVL